MGVAASRDTCRETPCFSGLSHGHHAEPSPAPEPIRVTVVGAAGQISYALLPMIASGGMFGPGQSVALQCLDLNTEPARENLRAVEMELWDGNFPLLKELLVTTDEKAAFHGADYAILLGAFPPKDGNGKREVMEKNVLIFRTMGRAIEEHAGKTCKVLVAGQPACTNTLICSHFAPSLPKENFFALTRLDQNRVQAQLAHRVKVPTSEVRNVIIWGGNPKYADVEHSTIQGRSLREVFTSDEDRAWLQESFHQELQQRGANILKARKGSSALSTARAIVEHIHALHLGTRPGEFASMGVWTAGREYSIASGLYFSLPVVCYGRGRFRVLPNLVLSQASKARVQQAEEELREERELATELMAAMKRSKSP